MPSEVTSETIIGFQELIEYEKQKNPDIKNITIKDADLLAQIFSNFDLKKSAHLFKPKAELLFLGAPTGAGKDTLVRRIETNSDKKYITLNLDKFRSYYSKIKESEERISDSTYAKVTNQTAYEIYFLIQEYILRNYPGTNIIITGTIHDKSWITEIANRFKNDSLTNYDMRLATLAVPINESAFSIIERYLVRVDENRKNNELSKPARYTDIEYHDKTIANFENNLAFYEQELLADPSTSTFSEISVSRRSNDLFDLAEDTLVYSSNPNRKKSNYTSAQEVVHNIMHAKQDIAPERIQKIIDLLEANRQYLEEQGLYEKIYLDLRLFVPGLESPKKGKKSTSQTPSQQPNSNINFPSSDESR